VGAAITGTTMLLQRLGQPVIVRIRDATHSTLTASAARVYLTNRLVIRMVQQAAADRLSKTFAALADPTRRAILARLREGEASVQDLAEPFDMSLPAISKHLRVLERAGLISRSRDAQRRPCRIAATPLKEATAWIMGYRRFWEESFDRLDTYLEEMKQEEKKNARRERRR
jgi:DNA-binding transcriptional ArsR family regulator